ncbi:MAG: hypothetical protein ACKV2T_39295 [Kofleriaceae bacterium]
MLPLGACTLWFGDDDDDDRCDVYPAAESTDGQPSIAPAPLRDPGDLTCDDYGGPYCDSSCGPCPLYEAALAPTPPIPSYNYCGHICETYSQDQCAADPQCRVVLDADCSIGTSVCFTNFMGCFPTDTQQDTSVNCTTADAWECSRSNECTAYHSAGQGACPPDSDCGRPFELCAPEGVDPGGCEQTVACDRLPPPCPSGTVPGVRDLCYTDVCIPVEFCD